MTKQHNLATSLCDKMMVWFCGGSDKIDRATWQRINLVEPAGTSVRNIVHWSQSVRRGVGHVAKFDYGAKNLLFYGTSTPSRYDLSSWPAAVPVIIYSGGRDILTTPSNTAYILDKLGNKVVYWKSVADYGHLDLIWANDAADVIYRSLIVRMRSMLKEQ